MTVPLALQSRQVAKEESAAASCTTDPARVRGQQSQPPSLGCDAEIAGAQKHLFHLSSCLGRCGSCRVCPADLSTETTWGGCGGWQLAASCAASVRAGILVGFAYGK